MAKLHAISFSPSTNFVFHGPKRFGSTCNFSKNTWPQGCPLDIYLLSEKWKELVDKTRAKQLQPHEYNSGTFTLSNLGLFGVDRFDAILPPSQLQPYSDCTVWIVEMGNEMGNQNVSEVQAQDSTKLESSKESVEVSVASINSNGKEDANQQSAPKEDCHENNTGSVSGDSSEAGDHINKQIINEREQDKTETQAPEDKTETQAPEESSEASMGLNNCTGMDGEMQSISSMEDGKFHQPTCSLPDENCPRTTDSQIQRQGSSGEEEEETRNSSLDTNSMVSLPVPMEFETLKSDQHESTIAHMELSVPSSEYEKITKHIGSTSEENLCRTNENQTHSWASTGGEEETRNPSLDSKSMVPYPQSVEWRRPNQQHKSIISQAALSIPSPENGNSDEHTGSSSDDDSSRTNDNQTMRHASIGGEGEDARNSSSIDTKSSVHDPKSMELENLKSDQQESTVADTELYVGASSKLLGSSGDSPRSSRTQDSEEKKHKLEDEVVHRLEEIHTPHSYIEVEKIREDMENMESQDKVVVDISNINGVKSEIINGIEVENTINGIEAENRCTTGPTPEVENIGNEEQEPTSPNSLGYGRDSRVSQSEAASSTESLDSFQIEASEPECKYVVLTNNRTMREKGSEGKQKGYDSNITFLSEGLLKESNADEMNICQSEYVIIGSDHGEERKESQLCDSYKSLIQNGFRVEDENVTPDVFRLNMLDSNQSLVSEDSYKELEGETNMVVVGIVSTGSLLTDGNHEEGKLPTSSSSSLDPTTNKVIVEGMEKTEDTDLIRKVQEGWGTIDSSLSQLQPIEPMENFFPPEEKFCTKGQVLAFANSVLVLDTKETDSIPEVEVHAEVSKLSNLDFEFPPNASTEKSNQTPILAPEKNAKIEEFKILEIQLDKQLQAKDKVPVLLSCGSETLLRTERLTTDSTPENINFHVAVSRPHSFDFEVSHEERIEGSDQTPLLSQAAKGDVFQLKSCGSKILPNRVYVNIENSDAGTESSALGADKEKFGRDQLPHEEMSAEKHVIALRRTSSEKLTPFLDFLKEGEKYADESAKKNKCPVAKKSAGDGWSLSTEKDTATSHRVREKRKPKYSLFSNCMGCTDVMP